MDTEQFYTWQKGKVVRFSAHFSSSEFECRNCTCTDQTISAELVKRLEAVRVLVGVPLVITSAYLCDDKQKLLAQQGAESPVWISQHQ
jgi:hypothetical protein